MKKHLTLLGILLLSSVVFSFVAARGALAAADELPPPCPEGAAFCPLAPIPGLTDTSATSVVQSQDLASFFNNLYKYLIGLAAAFAVVEIIWGGLEISTKDSVSKQSDGRARIQQALFGLVLVLSPVLIFSIINPSILNLSLNLQPLDTATTESPVATPAVPDLATECVVTGTLLKKAVCPSNETALAWAKTACAGAPSDYSFGRNWSSSCVQEDSANVCKRVQVYCELVSKELMFLDISYDWNPAMKFSSYQPLASIPENKNNGSDAVQFIASCTRDGGISCITDKDFFESDCTDLYTSYQPTNQSNECYMAKLRCYDNTWLNTSSECSSSPSYTPIQ